jgi:hypothetical protein
MAVADLLRLIVVLAGIALLIMDFVSFANRKMTESIGLGWAFFSLIMILSGAVPMWSNHTIVKESGYLVPVCILVLFVILGIFFLSQEVSQLIRKNQELAMQVSLLNQENERILRELGELTEKNKVSI